MSRKMKILRGLPGCGKTTYARELMSVNGNPYSTAEWARINYDQLRWFDENGLPKEYVYSKEAEAEIKKKAIQQAREYVAKGYDLIIDNTNLNEHATYPWLQLAGELEMEDEIYTFRTPLDECLIRNDLRTGWARVPRPVIERMALWNGFVVWPADQELVLVDLDGTLADLSHRHKYIDGLCKVPDCLNGKYYPQFDPGNAIDCQFCKGTGKSKKNWDLFFSTVCDDKLIKPTAEWVKSLAGKYYVCIVSGRPIDKAGQATVDWLAKYEIPYNRLFMRNSGDKRPDTIIKKEILDHLPKDRIAFCIDDRPCVIRTYRAEGLKVYDVGKGEEFQMDTQEWYKEWYQRMHELYDSEWDKFLREYVFSEDPPFKINARPTRILGEPK